jgi:hypothetical protein
MSVYGGFATRAQESHYNTLLATLLHLMSQKLLANAKNTVLNEDSWNSDYIRSFRSIRMLERHKYLPPRFGDECEEFADYILEISGLRGISPSRGSSRSSNS